MLRILTLIVLFYSFTSLAQISPPGLGKQSNVLWIAFGLKEDLDTLSHFQTVTYVGGARETKAAESSPYRHQGIFVINEELYHHFHKHWQYSLALSYRRQNEYMAAVPYKEADPAFKQEFRAYGRFMFLQQWKRLKLALAFRQEFRKFYDPAFHPWKESLQLRTRLKMQGTLYLSASKVHRLTLGAEALFTKSRFGSDWSAFVFSESRFTCFYSFAPKSAFIIYSIGYMDDALDDRNIPYLSLDLIFKNPFGLSKRIRSRSVDLAE